MTKLEPKHYGDLLAYLEVDCSTPGHRVAVTIEYCDIKEEDAIYCWYHVSINEVRCSLQDRLVMSLMEKLDEAVKLAGRLAKNAGINESAMTQALSQAYVMAMKDKGVPLTEEQVAMFTDTPCQES